MVILQNPQPTAFIIPDLHVLCSFRFQGSSHYTKATSESLAWVDRFNILSDEKLATFKKADAGLLCSYAYHYADYDEFRTCCDFLNLLYVFDVTSDDQTGADASHTGHILLKALRDPDFEDGSVLCAMTKRYFHLSCRFRSHMPHETTLQLPRPPYQNGSRNL